MKLNIVAGDVTSTSGYSIHVQSLIRALKEQGVDVALELWNLPEKWKELEFREEIEKDHTHENTLMVTYPDFFPMKSGDRIKKLMGYCVFEGDRIPYNWMRNIMSGRTYIDKIIVPSNHTKEAVLKAYRDFYPNYYKKKKYIIDIPVSVIPHGVDTDIFKPRGEKLYDDDKFRFLFVGGWRDGVNDRKGLDIALRAFVEEFKKDENVEFVAKINMAYQPPEAVQMNIQALGLPPRGTRPNITFDLSQNAPQEYMAKLYRSCDCAVFPSKAESFLLPALEAAACGLPVIANSYGGQSDYLPKKNLIKVEKMVRATGEPILYENTKWALPSLSHLKVLMRKAFENKLKSNSTIAKKYSWKRTAEAIVNEFQD